MQYLEKSILWNPWWVLSKNTCTALDAEEFSLSMAKPAPPLRDQPPPPPPPPKPPEPKQPPKGLIESFYDFKDWLNTPPPPKPKKAATKPEVKKPRVAPFDIQQIPDAMERIGCPMAAKLQRKWFAGELNYITSDKGEKLGLNQDGKQFPPSMIDTTMFKMDWILKFERAKEKYDELVRRRIFSENAKKTLVSKVVKSEPSPYIVDVWDLCGRDMQKLHNHWQYQFIDVDANGGEQFAMLFRGVQWKSGRFMDDLYGALGAFAFYLALGRYRYTTYVTYERRQRGRLEIHEVFAYMRDIFTFYDRPSDGGSQYLGHWNKGGFIVVPAAFAAGRITKSRWARFPVAKNGALQDWTVYYPVSNDDYRNWQIEHKQGEDLILYSDMRKIYFHRPIIIDFDLLTGEIS
ncbi:DUF6402 family protein [Ralstonia mannitolilytica]